MFSRTKLPLLLALAALATASACNSELDGKATAVVERAPTSTESRTPTPATRTLELDPARSRIEFVGAKVTADHRGNFGQPHGQLQLDAADQVVGMLVTVDTRNVDIEPDKLEQHLRSPDFFDVDEYPTAQFRLASLAPAAGPGGVTHEVTGDLELHGITKRISFPATAQVSPEHVAAQASFKIDRKDFGIVYAGMADDLIEDEVLLEMRLDFGGKAADRS